MATVYGVNKTLVRTPDINNRLAAGLFDGRVKLVYDTYECDALAIASVIEMCPKIPLNAIILDVILHTDDLTNNTTLKVGDYEDPDRYIVATDHGAGAELVTRMGIGDIDGRGYTMDETTPGATTSDRQIIITTAAGIATGSIKLLVLFAHD